MQFDHIGLLVKDCEKTTKIFNTLFGPIEWEYIDYQFPEEVLFIGKAFEIRTANATIDGKKIEIIEPIKGEDSYMMTHLKSHGEGLHHLAYKFDTEEERKEAVDRLLAAGNIAVHASERRPGHKSHYIVSPAGGMIFELFV